jgi:soluble lytic murein transglycosylase-like protein
VDLQAVAQALAQKYGIPPDLFGSLIASESGWDPKAYNPKSGALGIAQFLAETARRYGVDRLDPISSLDGAARYLRDIWQGIGQGDWLRSIAIYKGYSDPDAARSIVGQMLQKYGADPFSGWIKPQKDVDERIKQAQSSWGFIDWIKRASWLSVVALLIVILGLWGMIR